jgi:hypothetical protein
MNAIVLMNCSSDCERDFDVQKKTLQVFPPHLIGLRPKQTAN